MTDYQKEFTELVASAGVPTDEASIKAKFEEERVAAGLTINNSSKYSPFWNVVTRFFITPVLWLLREVLIKTVLPQSFLKTATGIWQDLLAWAYNVTRKQANKVQGMIKFARLFSVGNLPIPAGTIVQSPAINGKVYKLRTLVDAVIEDGDVDVSVLCEALEAGEAYNLSDGYYTVLEQTIADIVSVTNGEGWITSPGTDLEPDEELRARARLQFNSLGHYHTDAVYKMIMASFPGVKVSNIYFVHDAPRGAGTADAYILFEQDAPAADYVEAINHYITGQENHGHGDDLQVFTMPEDGHDIAVTWVPKDWVDDDDIEGNTAEIDNFIRAAFRENKDYTPTLVAPESIFSFSLLGGELHSSFPFIKTLHFANTDITSLVTVPVIDSLVVTAA